MRVQACDTHGRLILPSTAFTVPTCRQPQCQTRTAVQGLPPQFVEQYETAGRQFQNLQRVEWQNFDVVGTGGNIRFIGAAFGLLLIALVVEALGRTSVGNISDSEFDRENPSKESPEKSMKAEMQQQSPAIQLPLQLELEKYLRESENTVASRESSITYTVIAWALFTFALEAFNRTPDLPLQP